MKKTLLFLISIITLIHAEDFDTYLKNFDYKARKEMKISTYEMLELVANNEAQLIDIRFKEEFEAWSMGFAKNIPLNELPKRLNELDKNKLIITACPHNDRANIARMFLYFKGYRVRYLSDGLLRTADTLRGDRAKEFIQESK
ncbi:rhodanese-like domain-containing protein [Sulfurovum sp. XTW-4]|uniref:Rhodanese-like domain-containing protein n=1 Tax=Sulfurovum xiamenensis TaxID=3019066 RepID=A0ABT7QQ29_9BACT|nr:rhodanese-like domain-containing protein [Sulfurovum xiamenensis]MDM5262964.1 rhodanese-like domain-containing protein [Sulfurovum xiamenensis]